MFKAYTDGGSRGNPGPSAAAGVIFSPENKQLVEVSKFLGTQTNNYAEYTGLIITLEKCISLKITKLQVFMDSKLVVEQMNGTWKVKKLQVLFNTAKELVTHFESITFTHLRRELNKHADSLVNQCLDSSHDDLSDKLSHCLLD
jgi:ribonuclease HI